MMSKKYIKYIIAIFIVTVFSILNLNGCKSIESNKNQIVFGTTFNVNSLDPAKDYNGWYSVRYGVCETLFNLDESMNVVMNLAESYKNIDDYTYEITIRDDVYFQNDDKMTLEKVKASLERAISVNDRAKTTLKISNIDIKDNKLIITTYDKNPTLINDLCDPFSSIVNVEATEDFDNFPIGTGPFKVKIFNPLKYSIFEKNTNYYKGEVKTDSIKVISVSDADTLTMAMQSGEIDIAQGIPYSSLRLFNDTSYYKIETCDTSRAIVLYYNFNNDLLKDDNLRKAINYAINKNDYSEILLNKSAAKAVGPIPVSIEDDFEDEEYDLEKAKQILKENGYIDTNNDKILEKDGKPLKFKIISYSSRAELPLIAQAIQDDLKTIGIDITIEITDSIMEKLNTSDFDLALYSNITMSSGEISPYINNLYKTNGSSNYGNFSNSNIDKMITELNDEFDSEKRNLISKNIIQESLDNDAFSFISHIRMNFVMKKDVMNFTPHPTDYYQFKYDTYIDNSKEN